MRRSVAVEGEHDEDADPGSSAHFKDGCFEHTFNSTQVNSPRKATLAVKEGAFYPLPAWFSS